MQCSKLYVSLKQWKHNVIIMIIQYYDINITIFIKINYNIYYNNILQYTYVCQQYNITTVNKILY